MGMPGLYVSLQKTGGTEYFIPYTDKFTISTAQKWFKPLEELYEFTKKLAGNIAKDASSIIGGSLGAAIAGGTVGALEQAQKIFGFQLFTEAYQAQAWAGSEPFSMSLNLNFFLGMDDKWEAAFEVYNPIMDIMSLTVPNKFGEGKNFGIGIQSPGPNAIDVFKTFADSLFSDKSDDITKTSNNSTWTVKIGYSRGNNAIDKAFFTLTNLVVKSSQMSFSNELDSFGYPIEGNVTLSLSAQTLILSNVFTQSSQLTTTGLVGVGTPTSNGVTP